MSLQPQETFQSPQLDTNTSQLYDTSLSFSAIMDQPTTKPVQDAGTPPAGKGTETSKAKDAGEGSDKAQDQAKAEDDVPEAVKKYLQGQGSKPAQGPSGPVERDPEPSKPKDGKDKPDAPAKPGEIKYKFNESQIEEAKKVAKEKGLPLVVVVGSSGCGWCNKLHGEMEKPDGAENQYNGKVVFLNINASNRAPGSEEFTTGVKGYPTTKIGTIQDDGSFKAQEVRNGFMYSDAVKRLIGKYADK